MNEVQPIRDPEKIENMKQILLQHSYRDWFLFVMGINTGLRISDLLQLQVKDVLNKTHVTIREKKTDKTKRFRINTELQEHISKYARGKGPDDYLYRSKRSNEPIQRVQAYKILKDAAKEAGIEDLGTHTLRKTFGYHFYKRTKDVALLQDIFNHSAPSITLRYIGINQDIIDQALDDFSL
ncbi:site-specific integrase [Lentibacillus cibarius]|uniref:Site-specific integrase n=1 Tax=Lentibacillus cibarius TaxID=2583219 RepID=A0A549YLT7_9BACI|nr:site-specific integrase [Lentibacillus cibarius]TRM08780.1 site-specific integrase [Lentibacillus cibarius]TRM08808.1 site-specific integrase [Lentibacillus cibarius]TRM12855.1 site-specific integrase [Lentibacillus cibarius]